MPETLKTSSWPALPLEEWQETYEALHLWSQIAGKIKLALVPKINHWWHITFQLNSSGLGSGLIHYKKSCFQMDFDFVRHLFIIRTEEGVSREIALKTRTVADFYRETMEQLGELGIAVKIWTQPVEMEFKTHFENDHKLRKYEPEYVERFWKILLESDRIFREFRSGFTGKASPVHFFWGSFDLALTFFSGRNAPAHPGAPNIGRAVMVEAYSRELCSMGFWPGAGFGQPAYYAYAYPEPEGYKNALIKPSAAFYDENFREFILPYESVRESEQAGKSLLSFLESAYGAAAKNADWDDELMQMRS